MSSTLNWSNFEMHKDFKSAKLRILQQNCNRLTNIMQRLLEYVVKNANVVLLQESWIENNNIQISHLAFIKIAFNIKRNAKAKTMAFISKETNLYCTSSYNISNDLDI